MHRFIRVLTITAAAASALIWTNAIAQSDTQGSARPGYRHAFAVMSGGHYFGEDEPPEVQRLSVDELWAKLSYGSPDFYRVKAKGQVAQLRDRLDKAHALTNQQVQLTERILIEVRDRQARDLTEEYAGHFITSSGSSWTGMITLASNELGTSDHDQQLAEIEDFSRQQIAAVAPLLTAQQLKVYQQIQRERVASQKAFVEDSITQGPESLAHEPPRPAVRLGIVYDYNPTEQSKPLPVGALVARVESGSVAERAGLLQGDRIVRFDDHDIRGSDLQTIMATKKPGDTVGMVVIRNGVETPLVAQF